MKLQHELNAVSMLILILLSIAIVSAGIVMITRTVYDLNTRLLQLELSNVKNKIESVYNILVETDLSNVDRYVKSAQGEVVSGLAGYRFGESGHLYILTDGEKVIYHRDLTAGTRLSYPFAATLVLREHGTMEYEYNGKTRFCVFETFKPWRWTIALSITTDEMFAYRATFIRIVTIVTALILLLSIITFLLFSRRITGSIGRTLAGLKEVEEGNLDVRIVPQTRTEEIVRLQQGINSMVEKIRQRTEELLQSKEEKMRIEKRLLQEELQHKEAEISALQSQINPHFLYNTLECMNSIGALHDVAEIQEIAMSLSDLFKYAIKGGKIVPVSEEIRSVENYLKIQKIRFLDKFQVDICVDSSIGQMKMLKFLLQPIIENSIFHGLEPKLGKGNLRINGTLSRGFIEFVIEDDGIGMESESLSFLRSGLSETSSAPAVLETSERRSVGLFNIQNRIKLVYGDQYGLDIDSNRHAGTTVRMRLPRL
ncbi:sensor histidine kinase [Salinispira pacifica]